MLLLATDALERRLVVLHILELTRTGVALHPMPVGVLELGSIADRTIEVPVRLVQVLSQVAYHLPWLSTGNGANPRVLHAIRSTDWVRRKSTWVGGPPSIGLRPWLTSRDSRLDGGRQAGRRLLTQSTAFIYAGTRTRSFRDTTKPAVPMTAGSCRQMMSSLSRHPSRVSPVQEGSCEASFDYINCSRSSSRS